MAKAKVKIELEAQTKEASKNIALLEAHLQKLQERLKKSDIGSAEFKALGNEIQNVTNKIERASGAMKKMETLDAAAVLGRLGVEISFLIGSFSTFIQKAKSMNKSAQALRGEAKLMGVTFESLSKVAENVKTQFGLSAQIANGYATEVAKLAVKAGDASKTQLAIAKLLDLSAAKGLSAEESLTAVKQALLGIDEGTDKLFGKNPSVLYEEYAKAIGATAGKLTDQQKAQALLTAVISEGNKVEGERLKYLQSAAGAQERYKQSIDELTASIGQEFLKVLKPMLQFLNEGLKLLNQLDSNTVAATLAFVAFGYAIYQIVAALQAFRVAMTMATGGIYALLAAIGGGLTAALIVMNQNTDEGEKSLKALENRVGKTGQSFAGLATQMNAVTNTSSDLVDELKKLNDEYDKIVKEKSTPKSIGEFEDAIKKQYDSVRAIRTEIERKMGEDISSILNRRDVLAKIVESNKSLTDTTPEQKALSELNALLKGYEESNLQLLVLQAQMRNFKALSMGVRSSRARERKLNVDFNVEFMRPDLPALDVSMLNLPNVDQGQFDAISQRKSYQRYQSGMMRRIENAGQERNLGDLQMFRQINEARATQAKNRGDAREFEDALSAIEKIDEISKEINNTFDGAQRYVDILGSGMNQVADAFGDQVAASIFNQSFSIGAVFQNIAQQFVSQIVSEFLKQQVFKSILSFIPGGGLLSGFFADGGRPSVGRVSVVGERGAEFFKPDVPGRVVSSKEASSQVAAMLDLFERPSAQVDVSEVSRLIAVQTNETVRLRKILTSKEFAVDIDGEKANSRLKRVERRVESRVY